MKPRSEFIEYILELLEPSGGISLKRMFGGYSVCKFGLSIALIFEDEIYFKVDDSNRSDYEAINSEPFTYEKKGKTIIVSNWKVPIEIYWIHYGNGHCRLVDFCDIIQSISG